MDKNTSIVIKILGTYEIIQLLVYFIYGKKHFCVPTEKNGTNYKLQYLLKIMQYRTLSTNKPRAGLLRTIGIYTISIKVKFYLLK